MILPDQPPPTPSTGDVWAELLSATPLPPTLRAMCVERRQVGIDRYGTPLQRGNGRLGDVDLVQELLDAAVYAWALDRRWVARLALVLAWWVA